tara:strand:- start:53 stop:331 length:279 start_codon:yes stop_codon:yes gene_type:complete
MKKLTVVRFKPKSGCHATFVEALKEQARSAEHVEHRIMQTENEVVAISIRDAEKLQDSANQGIVWLDQHRHLLEEYNSSDRHTIFMTGDLVQ